MALWLKVETPQYTVMPIRIQATELVALEFPLTLMEQVTHSKLNNRLMELSNRHPLPRMEQIMEERMETKDIIITTTQFKYEKR